MPGIDFIERQCAVRDSQNHTRVIASARADGFERGGVDAVPAQRREQRNREDGFAHARVRAGDEKGAVHLVVANMKDEWTASAGECWCFGPAAKSLQLSFSCT